MSKHMTLGELIDALEALPSSLRFPLLLAGPHSYRGYYDQIAFAPVEPFEPESCANLLAEARDAVDGSFQGYKGGTYDMGRGTPVWVAAYGHCGWPLTRGLFDALVAEAKS